MTNEDIELDDQMKNFAPEPIELGDREEMLVNKVTKNYYDTIQSAWWQTKIKDWQELHKIYLGKLDNTSFPWQDASNCDLGIIEMCTDNIKSRYKLSTIGAKPMFNTIPISEEGEARKQEVTDAMNYILDNDIDIERVLDQVAQNTVEFGTCPVKLYWKKDILEQREYENIGEVIIPRDKMSVEEKGSVDVINLEDMIVPEGSGGDLQKLPWVFHRIWMSIYDLEKKVKLGIYSQDVVDQVKASIQLEKEQAFKTPEEKLQVIKKLPEEKVEI